MFCLTYELLNLLQAKNNENAASDLITKNTYLRYLIDRIVLRDSIANDLTKKCKNVGSNHPLLKNIRYLI